VKIWSASERLTLDKALRSNADLYGDKSFVEWNGSSLTYDQFGVRVSQVANALRGHGIPRGGHVLVMLPNSPDHLSILFGIHRAGCVYVACSTMYPLDEVRYQLLHSDAVAAITTPDNADMMRAIARDANRSIVVLTADASAPNDFEEVFATGDSRWEEPPPDPGELATLIYTSGTTARPKGVMWTHAQVHTSGRRGRDALAYQHEDRFLHFFPLYHSNGGAAVLNPIILVGGTLVMAPKFSASRFAQTLHDERVTMTAVNATHVKMLMEQPPCPLDRGHPTSRAQFGLFLEPARRRAFQDRFGIRLVEIYGMTESAGHVTASPVWTHHSDDSCGPPLPGIQMRLVDEHGDDVPIGEKGEILMRSDTPDGFCVGYYNDQASTDELFRDGWLHSGDVAFFDDEGYLHFVERGKDMIKRSGYNVAAAEVERALLEHPDVLEAAVVGIPDEMREEAIVAYVVGVRQRPGPIPEEIVGFCAERLAPYKCPQFVAVIDRLPENFLGKVEKKVLRERAAEQFGGRA
jgi:crotonobetaine/carnitine-CoA ligase